MPSSEHCPFLLSPAFLRAQEECVPEREIHQKDNTEDPDNSFMHALVTKRVLTGGVLLPVCRPWFAPLAKQSLSSLLAEDLLELLHSTRKAIK